jgi:hypothetical protein
MEEHGEIREWRRYAPEGTGAEISINSPAEVHRCYRRSYRSGRS